MTDFTALTPVEIDTELAANWEKQDRLIREIVRSNDIVDRERQEYIRRNGNEDGFGEGYDYTADVMRRVEKYKEDLRVLRTEAAPYEDEYSRRGGWNRYFLVTNSNGHVHRNMNCSTCYPTTSYSWIVNLADCDETAMVEEYGTMACTVCFPDAPTLPAWKAAEERDAAVEAEKAAKVCPGSGEDSPQYGRLRYDYCDVCGDYVSVTRSGKLRKHDRKEA